MTAVKLTARKLQAIQTKDKIYNSALKVICEEGYENASIEAITSAAGVSVGSFYTYFLSKEHVLIYTYEKSSVIFEKALKEAEKYPFPESLYIFVKRSYDRLEERGAEIIRALAMNMASQDFKFKIRDKERAIYKCLTEIVKAAQKAEKLNPALETSFYVEKIFITLTGVEMYWCWCDFEQKFGDLAEENIHTLIKGLMQY